MAIVPYMFVPTSIFDQCLKIGSDSILQPVSFIPLIDSNYSTPLNGDGVRCLKYNQDDTAPVPSGIFQLASTGVSYNLTAIPYTSP